MYGVAYGQLPQMNFGGCSYVVVGFDHVQHF